MKVRKKKRIKIRLGSKFSLLMRTRFREKVKELKKYTRKKKHNKKEDLAQILFFTILWVHLFALNQVIQITLVTENSYDKKKESER